MAKALTEVYLQGDLSDWTSVQVCYAHSHQPLPMVDRLLLDVSVGASWSELRVVYSSGATEKFKLAPTPTKKQPQQVVQSSTKPTVQPRHIKCSLAINKSVSGKGHTLVRGSEVTVSDPHHGLMDGTVEATWVLGYSDKVQVELNDGSIWSGPERCVKLRTAGGIVTRTLRVDDIGKPCEVRPTGGPMFTGELVDIYADQALAPSAKVETMDGGMLHIWAGHEKHVTVMAQGGVVAKTGMARRLDKKVTRLDVCDECNGTGFVDLFTGKSPCSKGCKP